MVTTEADVIVIGGGVAGLAAARELARKKLSVILVEARARLGGRILTQRNRGWERPIELGAEFIHEGNPPLWKIVREHRLRTLPMPGRHWLYRNGHLKRIDDLADRIERVTGRIDEKKVGSKSFARFLATERRKISEEDAAVATGFVEGFEAAPASAMSARALAGATLDDEKQFLLPGGYDRVVQALVGGLSSDRVRVICGAPVRNVAWQRGRVFVQTNRETYAAKAAIVTLPLGVLQAKAGQRGAVCFDPPLRAKEKVWTGMRMGHVTRLVVRFDARKWRGLLPDDVRRGRGAIGFIHSRVPGVPVWWALRNDSIVTAWAGGPAALALAGQTRRAVFDRAVASLATLLKTPAAAIRGAVLGWEMHDWSRDPFSRGAYSFTAVDADDAPARLRKPIQATLFFAGEATAEGEETGTVHGALVSGLRAAREIIASRKAR